MIIDLHSHSIKSDDGRAKVANYCQWIRAKELPIEGFVLTEHRQYDDESDYRALAEKHGLTILKGSELETEYGHVLVFGVTRPLIEALDFAAIDLPLAQVLEVSAAHDAVAVPCHPGRPRVGMAAHIETFGIPVGVQIIETYNGGSRDDEDAIAKELADSQGYRGVGGSDAHIVSHIGRCATRFPAAIQSEVELAEALRAGEFEPLSYRGNA